ncbi:hypothetical protein GGI22_005989, partial [Coemansia erecta]
MDSEKTTLSDANHEHEAEYNEVLAELRDAIFRRRPSDVYQYCLTHFHHKLAEQREGLLELVKMNPDILDPSGPAGSGTGRGVSASAASTTAGAMSAASAGVGAAAASSSSSLSMRQEPPRESGPEARDGADDAHPSLRQASEHAWSRAQGSSMHSMINPSFSFGSRQQRAETEAAAADDEMKVDEDEENEEARDKFSSL